MAVTVYATYEFYTGTFLGTAITEADFPRLALRASAVIDQVTFDRATTQTDDDILVSLSMACCAVAEEIQAENTNGNADGVTSEHVGTWSVTYGTNSRAALTNEEKQARVAKLYLAQTGLMYPGIEHAHQR